MRTDRFTVGPAWSVLFADLGVSAADVLRRADLPGDLISRAALELPAADFYRMWLALEEVSGRPDLPVAVAERLSAESFSPPLFAGLVSRDLNAAAERIARYKRLVGPVSTEVVVGSSVTTIEYHWPRGLATPTVLGLTDLLFWVALARMGTRQRIRAARMTAPQPPADGAPYVEYAGVAVDAGPYYSISFAAIDARVPFLTANEALWKGFEPQLTQRLSELESSATTTDRVRAALIELIPAGTPTVRAVAQSLAMSTRTLHRRLQADGATFQGILNDTRESLARHYLADTELSATEIAFLLGYEEPSSFYRAFHSWTGQTPDGVRSAST